MKRFITYFDFLGYKQFILNNNSQYISDRVGHILRDVESSLGQGNFIKKNNYSFISDLSKSKINCLNFSDTVIFWTNDNSKEDLKELINVTYKFNWSEIIFNFPVRGAMVFDEVDLIQGYQENNLGGTYNVNSIYGKGLVKAFLKAENLNWAGCVIDDSVISEIKKDGDIIEMLEKLAIRYSVPYKCTTQIYEPEYAFRLVEGIINEETFKNWSRNIKENFSNDNKDISKPRVQELLTNTIKFIEAVLEK